MNNTTTEAELTSIGRAVRFGFIGISLGVSYPNIRLALLLHRFDQMYRDLLGGKSLPTTTALVMHSQPLLLGISIAIPLLAVVLIWFAPLSRSLWAAGAVIIAVFFQLYFTCTAVAIPLVTIIGGTTP